MRSPPANIYAFDFENTVDIKHLRTKVATSALDLLDHEVVEMWINQSSVYIPVVFLNKP